MRGTPATHVVGMRVALPVRPKPPLMSRQYASMGLDVGLRACVLPTGKFPPLTPLEKCLVLRLQPKFPTSGGLGWDYIGLCAPDFPPETPPGTPFQLVLRVWPKKKWISLGS